MDWYGIWFDSLLCLLDVKQQALHLTANIVDASLNRFVLYKELFDSPFMESSKFYFLCLSACQITAVVIDGMHIELIKRRYSFVDP